jgi:hypothetical protein
MGPESTRNPNEATELQQDHAHKLLLATRPDRRIVLRLRLPRGPQ